MDLKEKIKKMIVDNVELVITSDGQRLNRTQSFIIVGLLGIQNQYNIKWVSPTKLFKSTNDRLGIGKIYFYQAVKDLVEAGLLIRREEGGKRFKISLNSKNPELKSFVINSGIKYLSEVQGK